MQETSVETLHITQRYGVYLTMLSCIHLLLMPQMPTQRLSGQNRTPMVVRTLKLTRLGTLLVQLQTVGLVLPLTWQQARSSMSLASLSTVLLIRTSSGLSPSTTRLATRNTSLETQRWVIPTLLMKQRRSGRMATQHTSRPLV